LVPKNINIFFLKKRKKKKEKEEEVYSNALWFKALSTKKKAK
jgi:hypothetical protein